MAAIVTDVAFAPRTALLAGHASVSSVDGKPRAANVIVILVDDLGYAEVKEKMRNGIPAHHEPPGPTYNLPGRKRKSR